MGFSIGSLTKIPLGIQGENKSRVIQISVKDWLDERPDATISVMVCRPGENTIYPAEIKIKDGILIWRPSRKELGIAGEGTAQFILTDKDDVELRSRVVKTVIEKSIEGTEGPLPGPEDGWVSNVINAANKAVEAVANMPDIGENGNWLIWDENEEKYVDSGVRAKGEPGEPGQSPTHKWIGTTLHITSASGTSSADLKGEKGDEGTPGKGLTILDYYETLAALKAAVSSPSPGDAYGVGAEEPYDIYIYGKDSGWVNNGHLQGVDGETPVKGVDYWTEEDKQGIIDDVIAQIPDVTDEVDAYTDLLGDLEATVNAMSDSSGGGSSAVITDETLKTENGVLKVNTTDVIEADNDLPVTSAAVYAEFAAIEALLKTI